MKVARLVTTAHSVGIISGRRTVSVIRFVTAVEVECARSRTSISVRAAIREVSRAPSARKDWFGGARVSGWISERPRASARTVQVRRAEAPVDVTRGAAGRSKRAMTTVSVIVLFVIVEIQNDLCPFWSTLGGLVPEVLYVLL